MDFYQSLTKHLTIQATTVKNLINSRLYPNVAPEKSGFPYAVYAQFAPDQYSHIMGDDSGYLDRYIQIDAYAKTFSECQSIAKAIRKSLMNFKGELGGTGGVVIQSVEIEGEQSDYETETKLYRVIQEYKFTYIEEV